MTNKVLVIAGMHRSGTSVISQWLFKCGLNIGSNFLGPSVGNVEGHFEDVDFYTLHEEILQAHALPNSGLTDHPLGELSTGEILKIKNLIDNKNQSSGEWGWKDPRTCLFLPIYNQLIPEAFYLIIIRDYQSTVTSLINRLYNEADKRYRSMDWFTSFFWRTFRRHRRKKILYKKHSESYLKIWIAYNEKILKQARNLAKSAYILLDYAALYKDDKLVFSLLHDCWGFQLTYVDFKSVYKKELMSGAVNFEDFIQDKLLLDKANEFNKILQSHVFNGAAQTATSATALKL